MSTNFRERWETDSNGDTETATTLTIDGTTFSIAEIVTGRGVIFGKSGSGKSNTVGVLGERVLDYGIPALIVDAEGEHLGLQEQYDILHVGAHAACDVQIDADNAATLVDLIVDEHVPTILDLSEMFDADTVEAVVTGVAHRLFARQKTVQHPLLIVLEECHEYLPQRGTSEMSDILIQIAKRGRARGLGICGISQRPADVDKAFVAQCDWIVWHRLTWPNDTAVVADVLDSEYAEAVQTLATGEAFVLCDQDGVPRRIQWPRKQTSDYGSAPPIERALNSTPEQIDRAKIDTVFEHEETDDTDTSEGSDKTNGERGLGPLIVTYRVHARTTGTGYAQLGKPVTEHLGVDGEEAVAATPTDDGEQTVLDVIPGRAGTFVHETYERGGRYAQFTLGKAALAALGATPGDTLRVEAAGDHRVRVMVADHGGERT